MALTKRTMEQDELSQRELFMATIKRMWANIGRPEVTWDAVHDWDELFRIGGYKADAAAWAFEEAIRCE